MPWRAEPFRLFFPLGVLIAWIGVGHWAAYALGVTQGYSCFRHGLVQVQGFLTAFAVGFLFTALPRRTSSAPPSGTEIGVALACLLAAASAIAVDRWVAAEIGYLVLVGLMLRFVAHRLSPGGAGRRPPASFVLIPLGVSCGIGGAALLIVGGELGGSAWTLGLGRLLVEQGVFLCLTLAVLPLLWPLIAGYPPPADLGAAPLETAQAVGFFAAGGIIVLTLILEQVGYERSAMGLRAVAVALTLAWGARALRPPRKPGLHRKLVLLAAWLMPTGLAAAALWPEFRVAALHILFLGGFGLLAFAVATHVVVGHLDMPEAATGRPPAVVALGLGVLLALAARLAADSSDSYFIHLASASGCWVAGTATWLAWVGPRLLALPGATPTGPPQAARHPPT